MPIGNLKSLRQVKIKLLQLQKKATLRQSPFLLAPLHRCRGISRDEISRFIARRETIPLRDDMPITTAPPWSRARRSDTVGRARAAMTKMHLLWFCAFSPHAGFGLDGWAGPQTGTGYDWTTPELWQDMARVPSSAPSST